MPMQCKCPSSPTAHGVGRPGLQRRQSCRCEAAVSTARLGFLPRLRSNSRSPAHPGYSCPRRRAASPAAGVQHRHAGVTGSRLQRGAALLTVLWLTAALSAISLSVATSVRGEIDRASTTVDGVRGYYLATGGIDRTICFMLWGPNEKGEDGNARYWEQGMPRVYHQFPAGDVVVEVIPVTAKLNVNLATEEELFRLALALGAEPDRAGAIAAAVLDWRKPMAPNAVSQFDSQYLSRNPSFRGRHASFEQIEEVLLVQGMTPELFYGRYERNGEGRLVRRGGMKDCIAVYGGNSVFDVNSAEPALLVAIGMHPDAARQLVERRRHAPIHREQLGEIRQMAGEAGGRLVTGGNSIFTLRATARVRRQDGQLSDMRRSVAATVKFLGYGFRPPYHVLRWYDYAPTDTVAWQ
jgi:general secretion pathway protein K